MRILSLTFVLDDDNISHDTEYYISIIESALKANIDCEVIDRTGYSCRIDGQPI